jgi:hypothetical protein
MFKRAMLLPVALAALFTSGGANAQVQSSTVGNPTLLRVLEQLQTDLTALQGSVDGLETKKFYLTQDAFAPPGATLACAAGFHMASMWEIYDPSNLTYDTELGLRQADSGSGPPANANGWIRTGANATTGSGAAGVNCNAWTSTEGEGTVAMLRFSATATATGPWDASDDGCNQSNRVWCVQD